MKKLVNIRLPVIIACALATGIAVGYIFKFYGIDLLWLLLIVPVFAAAIVIATLIKKSYKPLIFILLTLLFFCLGTAECFFKLTKYEKDATEKEVTYSIYGIVEEKREAENFSYIIIKDVLLDNKKIDGKICAFLSDEYGDFCDIGYKVYFTGNLQHEDLFPYGKLNYNAQNNIKYSCFVNDGLVAEYKFSFFGSIRSRIRQVFYNNTDNDTAAICYAMLTGNSYDIESNAMQSFRYGGIAHIFAVSGLHISIIYSIIAFICKKLRLNKYATTAICVLFLFFYSGICGFTLSSVRAAIMCTAHMITKLSMQKPDSFNALALAVTAIIIVNPLNLFSVGFQLSVCAVGGIFMFSNNFGRYLRKIKIPRKISSSIGASLGAQLGTLPIMLANFGYISGAGLILNIVILPLLSMLFTVIFIGGAISVIILPLSSYIIPYIVLPMQATLSFLLTSGFEKALITGFGAGAFAFLYFVALCFLSDKLNLKFLYRSIAVACSVVILASYVLCQTYNPANGYKVIISAAGECGEVIFKSPQGTVVIISEYNNPSDVFDSLNTNYSTIPDAIIVLGGEQCVSILDKLEVNCNTAYAYQLYLNFQPYKQYNIHYEQQFTVCGIDFTYLDGYSLLAECNGVRTGICANKNIPIKKCDLLISAYENETCDSLNTVYFGLSGYKYNIYDFGELTYKIRDGNLYLTGFVPKRQCPN